MARSVARLRTGWSGTQDKGTGGGGYGFTAEITGGPALAKALMALGSARDIQRVVTRAEKAAMAPVAAAAKQNAPRASGGMADSIDVRSARGWPSGWAPSFGPPRWDQIEITSTRSSRSLGPSTTRPNHSYGPHGMRTRPRC